MTDWLIDEPVDDAAVRLSVHGEQAFTTRGEDDRAPAIAMRLHDLVVHNNRKWFNLIKGADVRVDVVVVQGNVLDGHPKTAFRAATFRFPNIGDGDRLPAEDLLVLAALVAFLTLALPVITRLRGAALPDLVTAHAPAVPRHPADTRLVPVRVRDGIEPVGQAGSAMLRGAASADAIAVAPPSTDTGRPVLVHPLPGGAQQWAG
jgi:hypothetical protein